MRSYLITVFLALVGLFHLNGQSTKYLKNEARLLVDNDAFTLNFFKDQYYTSGIYPGFRYVHDTTAHRKVIHGFKINHRMYTPKKISWRYEQLFDRPYAGQLSASFSSEYYFKSGKYLQVELEFGWMGPATKIGQMHRYWHKIWHMGLPKGWKYQINDSPIATLYLKYGHSVYSNNRLEILSESYLTGGTSNTWARQEITFRFGRFNSIDKSAYFAGQLGRVKKLLPIPELNEIYIFYAPGFEYVFYNATIEGNLIGESSPFVKVAVRNVVQHKYGMMMSWPSFDFGFTGYIRSKETTEADGHYYVGVQFNQRF
ncbi:MAG: lipid A deacylase LpxR family protein [Bacteroidota bacterium]